MSTTSPPDCQISSQLRSLRSEQIAHALHLGMLGGRLESIERLLHSLIPYLTRQPGPPSSSAPNPSPTPGLPSSILKPDLMKQVKALGELVRLLSMGTGVIKGAIGLLGLILPSLLLAATAVWKLLSPYLSRLLLGF